MNFTVLALGLGLRFIWINFVYDDVRKDPINETAFSFRTKTLHKQHKIPTV